MIGDDQHGAVQRIIDDGLEVVRRASSAALETLAVEVAFRRDGGLERHLQREAHQRQEFIRAPHGPGFFGVPGGV